MCPWGMKSVYTQSNKSSKKLTSMDFCSSEDTKLSYV